jgi:hypothetical protein
MNLAIISFEDVCVDEGMEALINKYGASNELTVFIPVTGNENHFVENVIEVCKSHSVKITCFIVNALDIDHLLISADDIVITDNPVKEIIRQITPNDVLGMVWDNSTQAHIILNAVEDFGIEVWDITEGLDKIEFDDSEGSTDDLYNAMMSSMTVFVEHMADYIMTTVLDVLALEVAKHIEDGNKDISPFKDDDL